MMQFAMIMSCWDDPNSSLSSTSLGFDGPSYFGSSTDSHIVDLIFALGLMVVRQTKIEKHVAYIVRETLC